MARRQSNKASHLRTQVANEAARIMREQGVKDYRLAKRKAAERLGARERSSLPGNDEIAAALTEQQRLFGGGLYEAHLQRLRTTAIRAMRLFEGFQPRLVGPVLTGAVTENSDVSLHVFADTPENIAMRLLENRIPYDIAERRVRYTSERTENMPAYRFMAGDVTVEIVVFPMASIRQPPTCPVDGRPMRRARLAELSELIGG
ncbi:MAG: hypothetical protein PVI25_01480 [Gammaproteobacteria bacterium]|jgi:hypothetical protein